ncbi:3-oxoacyl-ACP synthase [Streptomyces olivaceus]|uniref:3-oxoacyl-ACP synthase n=1 Tax=Streptomyces olivaceus TaxID=47716 RepID=A0ABS7WEE3_STROV|nr:3-oxoacyl-[acyl-carrier-protein] synthase III C-terminal domain-containing protein [Streptomyces olivaceus]MBZ6093498.1 3-oxoacyl-ACP synthase [Streptomyces olivaceus]MBZ6100431.1 3-oxoacyl-ACP synthase [Streptomyces olivaceus]MBZ6121595.1 3-oxoacyl-ACP synthase [Streptomyces olivaceus]MBZ6156331.1 3-oxoacyl-ACP synthase [Streptomyces olivaceus]MBZ6302857.1 3-oxoacyl-ACP synthase [Streptomyces olivaceus]
MAESAADYLRDLGKVRDWGIKGFHRSPDGVGATDLAVQAGRGALDKAGLTGADVDLVVLALTDVPEYLYWDASAATQAGLGASHAEAFLVNQACSGGVAAFDVVAGKFATHQEYRVALLIGVNRTCEQYWNRMDSGTSVMSDGAAAAVLVRGHAECTWLGTSVLSDGRFANAIRLAGGGTAAPFTGGSGAPEQVGNPIALMDEFYGHNLGELVRFLRFTQDRNHEVLQQTCKRAGVPVESVRHILHINGQLKVLQDYADSFGIPLENTNAAIAVEHGHFGSADQIMAFGLMHAEGRFSRGEPVALTSTGNGMHWACTLLRI